MELPLQLVVVRFGLRGVFIGHDDLLGGGGAGSPAAEYVLIISVEDDHLGDGAGAVGEEGVHEGGVFVAQDGEEVEVGAGVGHPVEDGEALGGVATPAFGDGQEEQLAVQGLEEGLGLGGQLGFAVQAVHPRLVEVGDLEVEVGLVGAGGFTLGQEVGQVLAVVGVGLGGGQGGLDRVGHAF